MSTNFNSKAEISNPKINFDKIFGFDESIRFLGLCSKKGKILEVKYRQGITPLISDKELLYSIVKSVERRNNRLDSEDSLGPTLYSMTAYANVKRATIPIDDDLLFVSFERKGDEHKILNQIHNHFHS